MPLMRSIIALITNVKCQETTRILCSKVLEDQNMSELEPPSPLLRSSQPPPPTKSDSSKREIKREDKRARRKQVQEEEVEEEDGNMGYMVGKTEDKAAKIRRLKSGFRICKPQGTFLWPNMAMSPQLQDDPFVVPTPPSANSSTTAAPRLISLSPSSIGPHPTSPVKPLARRPLTTTTTISNITSRPNLINLNEVPPHGPCDLAFCGTLTYQRRHSNATACHDLPNLVCGKQENDGVEGKECSGSASSTPSWLLMRDKWLLDLATSKSSLDLFSENDKEGDRREACIHQK
ncbi:uncharacterized protein LOC120067267 [Benincasa hispida]|uniref:uncharacterized protein LOC120067267 n=1 Tax=Benincasa hispida TaxID=102211 RepID=UPI00190054D1|nr:uncharacterized protein LOC120067267 [Benincasa hispida]